MSIWFCTNCKQVTHIQQMPCCANGNWVSFPPTEQPQLEVTTTTTHGNYMIRNKYDKDGSAYELGKTAEQKFIDYMENKGWNVVKTSVLEDMREHKDYTISRGDVKYTVDVKSEKKVARKDTNTNNERIWLEMQNVRGDIGWVYAENLDLIAFQDGEEFLIVDRKRLVEKMESLLTSQYVTKPYEALYKLYRRFGRNDLLTQVLKSDIMDLGLEL